MLASNNPHLWIYDVLDTEPAWLNRLHDDDITIVCIDDLRGGPSRAHLTINPIVGCWENAPSVDPAASVYNGPAYAILPPALYTYRKDRSRMSRAQRGLHLAVTMGGSDTYGATATIAKSLMAVDTKIDHVTFVLGPLFKHHDEMANATAQFPFSFTIRLAVADLHALLDTMDAVICAGGITLFEMCSMGLPALSLASEPHEEKTIAYFERKGACINLGSVHASSAEHIGERLTAILQDADRRGAVSANAMNLVDGRGIYRVCNLIFQQINTSRAFEFPVHYEPLSVTQTYGTEEKTYGNRL